MNDQNSAKMNQKVAEFSMSSATFQRLNIRLWQDRLFQQTYRNNGHLHLVHPHKWGNVN